MQKGILLIEDSPADAVLMREAMRIAGIDTALEVYHIGEDALAYLDNLPPQDCRLPFCSTFTCPECLESKSSRLFTTICACGNYP
ncbi:MAG: hypothetical protein OHK0039_43240 [Bacteroidia bacterium]